MRKRVLILVLIIGIPMIPAVAVHYLIRETPPGANTSPVADEIAAALDRLPAPSGEAVELRYDFDVGEAWVIATRFDSPRDGVEHLPEGAAPDPSFRDELARRGGRFRFEVAGTGADGWHVRLTALEGADDRWVGDGVDLLWGRLGDLAWLEPASLGEGADRDVRAVLAQETGIHVPGWFERPVRDWERFAAPPTDISFKAVDVMKRLGVVLGATSIPPQGGRFHAGLHDDGSGRRGFQWLAYRRRLASGELWVGRLESVWSGELWAPSDALHLASGEIRLNEVFRLRRDHTTIATADHVVRVRQTATEERR